MTAVAKHKQILDQVREVLAGMAGSSLDGIAAANVKVALWPAPERLKDAGIITALPTIIVSPNGVEEISGGTNAQDDYGYPCLVAIVGATDQSFALSDKFLTWRETIIKKFHNKNATAIGFSGLSTVWRTTARAGSIVDFANFAANGYSVSFITIVCTDRSTRA
jgi:hypothetical protein